jgi:hypothetical protein
MAWAAAIPAVLSVFSSLSAGKEEDRGAQNDAAQLDYRAGQSRATAQRQAQEERRQTRLKQSRLQAVAGSSDPGVVTLAQDIAGEGEYRALSALYEGESAARGDELAGATRRLQGKQAKKAASIGALTSAFSSGSKMYQSFGGGG